MKRVAIIGAGASGLAAIKCCLDEDLEPVCFERSSHIGGLWHYTDEATEGQACVMKSTVINTSKEMMCYSDFPIPEEFAIYMHNTYVDKYFHLFADKFGLKNHIQLKTEVLSVKQTKVFQTDGKWEIITRNAEKQQKTHIFDAVLVCSGHHADKNKPNFPGLDKFKGKVTHTHDYKDYHGYEDKRVLIIGIGNSGADVATELSRISSQVYLSTRSGSLIFHRVGVNGIPGDMVFSRRFGVALAQLFPKFTSGSLVKEVSQRFDHKKYCLKPKHHILGAIPTINDELPNRIISGGVIVKANVAEFTETGAVFEVDTKVDNLDAVVLATGYIFGFPFIDKSVIEVKENKVNLYKYMFPPDLTRPTLAVIGCFQPLGATIPISEMQCRLATLVFKSVVSFKSTGNQAVTWHWGDVERNSCKTGGNGSQIQEVYTPYITSGLCTIYGRTSRAEKLLLTDPVLAQECYFGACTPYQYRLMGPGQWKGARQAILTQWDRVFKPLQTRPCEVDEKKGFGTMYVLIILAIAVLLYFFISDCMT